MNANPLTGRRRHWARIAALALALVVAAAACGGDDDQARDQVGGDRDTVVLVTHDAFSISDDVLTQFERDTGYGVEIVLAGDAGTLTNQAVLTAGDPIGDLLYGIDDTFVTRALDANVFVPYEAPSLDAIDSRFDLDPQHRVTPIDYGDVCINFDKNFFSEGDLAPPDSVDDLVDPAYRGQTVVEDPSLSSPGLAFVAATAATRDDWEAYWQALRDNDVLVAPDWETAYFTHFSGGGGDGDRPIVVSYASSPVADVVLATDGRTESTIGVVDDLCYRQIEFAGVLDGAQNRPGAEALLEFMLSREFQADIPLNMFVFPARSDVELPEVFERLATVADGAVRMDHTDIGQRRDEIIETWTEIVVE